MEGDLSKVREGSATDLFLFALVFFTVFLLEEPLGVLVLQTVRLLPQVL